MNFNEIYKQFKRPTKSDFPIDNCTIQNKKEPNVYGCNKPYLCLVIDVRFKDYWQLKILYPYICVESENKTSFGWIDENKDVYCNIENSTQLWDEYVIGFQEYDESNYNELWNDFIRSVNEQYELDDESNVNN